MLTLANNPHPLNGDEGDEDGEEVVSEGMVRRRVIVVPVRVREKRVVTAAKGLVEVEVGVDSTRPCL